MDRAYDILLSLERGTPRHGRWVVECLRGSWSTVVGARLAGACRPIGMKGSVLEVAVLDDGWAGTLRGMRAELEDRLRSATSGAVETLAFSTGASARKHLPDKPQE